MCQITRKIGCAPITSTTGAWRAAGGTRKASGLETSRLIRQSNEQLTRRTQSDNLPVDRERITEISFWRSELGFELEQLLRDTERLRQVLVIAGISLQVANLYGYLRCKAGGQEVPPTSTSSFLQEQHVLQRPDIIYRML
ncbi:hypothetical protein J4Q44_G00292550 [Coregonus suidteri]|uniref:Uncharacterized protein n=1 Tax=Coregonus suidteri TaxID=861788 RepID=A0AAN8KYD6_9TELE